MIKSFLLLCSAQLWITCQGFSTLAPSSTARPLAFFRQGHHLPRSSTKDDDQDQQEVVLLHTDGLFGGESLEDMSLLLEELEMLNNACTEDATQTNIECDVVAKAERDWLMEQLQSRIAHAQKTNDVDRVKEYLRKSSMSNSSLNNNNNNNVNEMISMLADMERVQNECTEEWCQTDPQCDVEIKAEREALMEQLEYQIATARTDVAVVKACLESYYNNGSGNGGGCGMEEMTTMLADLERINNECTEECRQTDAECDIEVKAERAELIEKLSNIIANERTDVDEVKAYLASSSTTDVEEMTRMLADLERINSLCTEECHQTDVECDIEIKAEREELIEQLEYAIASARTDVDQVKDSIASEIPSDLDNMVQMLEDLERINYECTEECHQTDAACDIEVKAERDELIEKLSYAIASSRTDVDQVKECLASDIPCDLEDMVRMMEDLERINNECTEDCHQTDAACDIEVKAEREELMEKLSYAIANARTDVDQVKECLASDIPCDLEEMVRMMDDLERINNECTEECHQTDAACDIEVKAEREELMEKLSYAIASARTDVDEVKNYIQSDLIANDGGSIEEMTRMMEDLERINYECTEDCHQTDAECDIEVKAERDELIEKLAYAIASARTDVDQVKECLASDIPCDLEDMVRMMEDLERINYECTEDCHQTDTACDIEIKAERDELIEKLGYAIASSRTDVDEVKAFLESGSPCSVEEMVRMMEDLERINSECTEECHQTDTACDIEVKAEREALIQQLEERIATAETAVGEAQTETSFVI